MATPALATTDTRTRLIEVAVGLFTRHSFAGTSLQMIAAELGFTKAAIYHHFRTREQLLAAVLEPMLDELRTVVESAETRRTPHAKAEHMLSGYAALAVRNRGLVAVLSNLHAARMLAQTEVRGLASRHAIFRQLSWGICLYSSQIDPLTQTARVRSALFSGT